ncbi:TPA: hypothetical protein ACWL2W_005648, partial [Klebsiella pneumoniae]
MHRDYYQMAVLVSADNESSPEWPNKRKWFDARKWLETSQYIKIDDFYVLNERYIPIDVLDDFGITRRLQDSIKESINIEPALSSLNDIDAIVFFDLMKDNLSYEYLRTEFNN